MQFQGIFHDLKFHVARMLFFNATSMRYQYLMNLQHLILAVICVEKVENLRIDPTQFYDDHQQRLERDQAEDDRGRCTVYIVYI